MSSPESDFAALGPVFDGYLHQDFRAEYGDHEGAAGAFRRDASPEELAEAVAALEAFLEWAGGVPRTSWQAALERAGGSWRPRSLARVKEVLDVLRGH